MKQKLLYRLPRPDSVGLTWKPLEEAAAKIAGIEERSRQASMQARNLETRIRELEREDVRRLAASILDGTNDPGASLEEIEDLGRELREARRVKSALEAALPEAEEQVRQSVYEHQEAWIAEADDALEEALAAEKAAYKRAQQIGQKARARRLYLEALSDWVRRVPANFSVAADVVVASTTEQWEQDAARCARLLDERRENERLAHEEAARVANETGEGVA